MVSLFHHTEFFYHFLFRNGDLNLFFSTPLEYLGDVVYPLNSLENNLLQLFLNWSNMDAKI